MSYARLILKGIALKGLSKVESLDRYGLENLVKNSLVQWGHSRTPPRDPHFFNPTMLQLSAKEVLDHKVAIQENLAKNQENNASCYKNHS